MSDSLHKHFKTGDVAIMHITHRWSTPEGWACGGAAGPQQLRLYEKIGISSFPSHNDFLGDSQVLACGQPVMILGYAGRCYKITQIKEDSDYDVYDILVDGKKLQVLRWNLERPEDYEKVLASQQIT